MPPPNWIPGQVLVASDVNSWFTPEAAYKSADLSRSSNTTLAADPDLTVTLDASAVYAVTTVIMYACAALTVDLKFNFTLPAGASGEYVHWYWSGSTTFAGPANAADSWTTTRAANAQTGGDNALTGHGTIFTSTSGALVFQWAQNTSSATAVTLRKGCHLVAQRIG